MLSMPSPTAEQPQAKDGYSESARKCKATDAAHGVRPIFSSGKTVARASRQILRLRLDRRSAQTGYKGSNPTPSALVQRLQLAHTHQNRRWTAIQIRIQRILRGTWHSTRALFSIQSRKQWAGRSCSEESQGHRITLLRKRGKYTTYHSCLAQHKPPGRKLSMKTAARPALATAASGS